MLLKETFRNMSSLLLQHEEKHSQEQKGAVRSDESVPQGSHPIMNESTPRRSRYTHYACKHTTYIVHNTLSRITHPRCIRFRTPLLSGCGISSSNSSI